MDSGLAESTSKMMAQNEYREMHANDIKKDDESTFHLLQTDSNINMGVRFIEPESQFAMDPELAESTSKMMAVNEYKEMHANDIKKDDESQFHLLQTDSNINLGVRFIEKESQFAMDPTLAENTSNLMAANEYRQMHPVMQADDANVQTEFVGDEEIDNSLGGHLAQVIETNDSRTQDFSQIDTTDDIGHLYDAEHVQTAFVSESAQDAVDPSLPQRYAQMMNTNDNKAMLPPADAFDPNASIHLIQTGFVTGDDDISLAAATAKGMEEYEHAAMTQSLDKHFENMNI